ncbi:MAG: hypothetical protein KKE64_00655, partial [Candidatus Omnitrophica bacterium]|nr:hypothetical protein [Candidatus Omnitrophota bacterium]
IERIDLALSPAPELMVKVWGPKRVSPGQTISYIIEYRNDGLMGANEAIVSIELPTLSDYLLGSKGAFYNELAGTVSWDLGLLPAKAIGYLTVQVSFPWGLPQGLEFNIPAYITLIEHHSTEDNLSLNGFQLKTKQIAPGKDNPDVIKYKTLTKLFDAKWLPVYTDLDFFEATPHALAAMLGIPTDKNGLVENQGNRPKVLTYSGSTISGVALIEKGLVTTKEFQAASTVLTYQDRLQKLSEKGVEKVVVYYSLNDDVIPKPIRLRYSANQESEFKIVVSDIEFPYQSQELSLKVKRMIEIGEEIFSKNFNKTLKVKTLNIFSDKVGNQVELEMVDEQGNIFPLLLPDGTLLPKPFYIQNDMKTG